MRFNPTQRTADEAKGPTSDVCFAPTEHVVLENHSRKVYAHLWFRGLLVRL